MDEKLILSQIVNDYPDAINNHKKMESLLLDFMPTDKLTRNILLMVLDENILSQLKIGDTVDQLTVHRFINNLVNDYGISSDLAEKAISAWMAALNVSISYSKCTDKINGANLEIRQDAVEKIQNANDQDIFQFDESSVQEWFELGEKYFNGINVKKDYCEALKWYLLAANQGFAKAEYMVGLCYQDMLGVDQNLPEALKWYRLATEHGDSEAPLNIALYLSGHGEKKESHKWLQIAAVRENADAQNFLASDYELGQGVDKDPQRALEWYLRAAENGSADAQNTMGEKYINGDGVQKNFSMAVKWFHMAAAQGDFMGQFNLGLAYEFKKGGTIDDLEEALKWYRTAYENMPIDNLPPTIMRVQEKIEIARIKSMSLR